MELFPAEKFKSDSDSLTNFGSFFPSKSSEGLMFDVSGIARHSGMAGAVAAC